MPSDVIKYVYIHFDTDLWTPELLPSAVMKYTATQNTRLIVVAEGDAGLWSYNFSMLVHDVVYVIGEFVHIPRHYTGKNNGNVF